MKNLQFAITAFGVPRLNAAAPLVSLLLLVSAGRAQTTPSGNAVSPDSPAMSASGTDHVSPTPPSRPVIPLREDKRAYGVLPNYRTAEADIPFSTISSHQKWMIGLKDSFDGSAYPLAAFFAGINQWSDTNHSFGQGVQGYAKRYGTALGDQVIGNMLTESTLPVILRQDPRFFRKATGRFWSRVAYSASRVVICKNDSGRNAFNVSEVLGNGIGGSIANLYYADERGFSPTMSRMFTAIGTDAVSNVLKEFWPDVKRYYIRKHREKLERQQKVPSVPAE